MTDHNQIFLSYSRNDLEVAASLRAQIEQRGLPVFKDDQSIREGDQWLTRLREAVDGCAGFVVLVGRDGVGRWIGAETQVALIRYFGPHEDAERLPIFPVLLGDTAPESLPAFLRLFQATRWNGRDLLPDLLDQIRDRKIVASEAAVFEGCPFVGLDAFRIDQAQLFFGRQKETLEALACFDNRPGSPTVRWLEINGNSGCGKSSLMNAGLLPLVDQGWLWPRTRIGHWQRIGPLMPGQNPLEMLAESLARFSRDVLKEPLEMAAVRPLLEADDRGLADWLRSRKRDDTAFLLAIDQFEELFTFADKDECKRFDRLLATVLADADCPLFVISTVRADFLDRFEDLPRLVNLRNRLGRPWTLPPIGEDGLREVIGGPARLANLDVSEVQEAMVDQAGGEPGALPLVENALNWLWEGREGNRLSGRQFNAQGGLAGILSRSADDLLAGLGNREHQRALELLFALVKVDLEGRRHSRRRIPRDEAIALAGGGKPGEALLNRLSGERDPHGDTARGPMRLITITEEAADTEGAGKHGGWVNLIHETLICSKAVDDKRNAEPYWPTLWNYIEASKEAVGRRELPQRSGPKFLHEVVPVRKTPAIANANFHSASSPAPATMKLDDDVQFTLYRPHEISPGNWYPLLCFAHLLERRADAPADVPDPLDQVREEAERALGERVHSYWPHTVDADRRIPRAGDLTFVPELPGIAVNPAQRSFRWLKDVHKEEFDINAPATLAGQTVKGTLNVFLGPIIIASLRFGIRVRSSVSTVHLSSAQQSFRTFRRIFPSYSHHDRGIVNAIIESCRALGDRYLQDVIILRSGEPWREKIEALIREADLFQLFWSWHSMRSPNVRAEWQYALSMRRDNFIRPTYWQVPMPRDLEHQLPPPDLDRLHFHWLPTSETPPRLPCGPEPSSTSGVAPPVPAPGNTSPASGALDDDEMHPSGSTVRASPQDLDAAFNAKALDLLRKRLEEDQGKGEVSEGRAKALSGLIDRLGRSMSSGESLDDLRKTASRIRELMGEADDYAQARQRDDLAGCGPAARRVYGGPSKTLVEVTRTSTDGREEGEVRDELFQDILDQLSYVRGQDLSEDAALEREATAWGLALKAQHLWRRHHVMIVEPLWDSPAVQMRPRRLFVAGDSFARAVEEAALRLGVEVLPKLPSHAVAQGRWDQLRSCGVALFDFGDSGLQRAQASYELGIALALGTPSAVFARGDDVPFDVDLPARQLGGTASDADIVEAGIVEAVFTPARMGQVDDPSALVHQTLAHFEQKYGAALERSSGSVALRMVRDASGDSYAFARTVETVLRTAKLSKPQVVRPAWPPYYADEMGGPGVCCHVTPFAPKFDEQADAAWRACNARGFRYVRHDMTKDPRIIRSLWREILGADRILVDLTDANPNVALELGLAHTVGKNVLLVAEDPVARFLFPSVKQIQTIKYTRGDNSFEDAVSRWLPY